MNKTFLSINLFLFLYCYNCNPLNIHDENLKKKHLKCPTQCYFCAFVSKEKADVIQHVKDLHLPKDREIDIGLAGKWHSIGPVMRPSLQCPDCKSNTETRFGQMLYAHMHR